MEWRVPVIEIVEINPNPVNHNANFKIAVKVIEETIELKPLIKYCGTFLCGEDTLP